MGKRYVRLAIVALSFLYLRQPIQAEVPFTTDAKVTYEVTSGGSTIVTHEYTLTNSTSESFPKEYRINLDHGQISDILARDHVGQLSTTRVQEGTRTEIAIPLDHAVPGIGKSTTFTLRYRDESIAVRSGTIWEITIAEIPDVSNLNSYTVTLRVDPSLGPNAFTVPIPSSGTNIWTKEDLLSGGIHAVYGQAQHFRFRLGYLMTNSGSEQSTERIALPPDTAYQQVLYADLNPLPVDVTEDGDGNYLAEYRVPPNSDLHVSADVSIMVTMEPASHQRNPPNVELYTSKQPYWDTDSELVTALATPSATVGDLYRNVLSVLSYGEDSPEIAGRQGADQALRNPGNALCNEFTDVFIALLRNQGIPARRVVGYAYTTNMRSRPLSLVENYLHSWPEYFDPERGNWVPVDPTWEETTGGIDYFSKLDFHHVVFAVNGTDSSTPLPAGLPTRPDVDQPEISMEIVQDFPEHRDRQYHILRGNGTNGEEIGSLVIRNVSGERLTGQTYRILATENVSVSTGTVSVLPPYGTEEITLPDVWDRTDLTVWIGDDSYPVSDRDAVQSRPSYRLPTMPLVLAACAIILLFTIWYGTIRR